MGKLKEKHINLILMITISLATITAWQFEIGRLILYPFTVLGTWFHEMGHGLMALILGGTFHELVMFPNGSGYAKWSGDVFGANFGRAMIAAAGPIGPTIAGTVFIIASTNQKWTNVISWILGIILIFSGFYWVRNMYGIAVVAGFGILTILIALKGTKRIKSMYLIFLGIQACLSVYLSIDYLLVNTANVTGESQLSDTGMISSELWLPHWFWGGAIILISVLSIWKSLSYAMKKG